MLFVDGFEWDDRFRIDDGPIDQQHREWITIANTLLSINNPMAQKTVFRKALIELIDYSRAHFATEERFLARIGYDRLQIQRDKHAEILRGMNGILSQSRDAFQLVRDLQSLLRQWIVDHIEQEDLLIRRYTVEDQNEPQG